jgi:hypothetical protein
MMKARGRETRADMGNVFRLRRAYEEPAKVRQLGLSESAGTAGACAPVSTESPASPLRTSPYIPSKVMCRENISVEVRDAAPGFTGAAEARLKR